MLVRPETICNKWSCSRKLSDRSGIAGTGDRPCGMVDQQLIALVRKFDRDGSGMLVIDRFVEAVCGRGDGDVDDGSAPY